MKRVRWLSLLCLTGSLLMHDPAQAAEYVINGDFETDHLEFIVWPGYTGGTNDQGDINPDEIPEWYGAGGRGINPVGNANAPEINSWLGTGGRGINPLITGESPFRDNGDNDTQVAFLQGDSSIHQSISGLTVGSDYTLSWDFNSRNCCGDQPIGIFRLDGDEISVADFSDIIMPVGDIEPWYSTSYNFTATASTIDIEFGGTPAIAGDATLLLDNVALVENGSTTNLVTNGEFENDEYNVWPGYVGSGNAPFADNGNNTSAIAFLQGTASLSQIVSGLTPGETYVLSFDYNARNCCDDVPIPGLLIDQDPVADFPPDDQIDGLAPVGGANPWYHYEQTFVADSDSFELTIQTTSAAGGDSTLIVDNVSVASPSVDGDFNRDGVLSALDIDLLSEEVRAGTNLAEFDMNSDGKVDEADRKVWVEDVKRTYFGDSNLDGQFDSGDFVEVFSRGEYEDNIPGNSTWADGDWDASGDFDSGDFVTAFVSGGYEAGPRAAVSAVPEPSGLLLALIGGLGLLRRRK